jgi:hypothetical protein
VEARRSADGLIGTGSLALPAIRGLVAGVSTCRACSWMVLDPQGQLVCLTVYTRGAVEVVRRLAA